MRLLLTSDTQTEFSNLDLCEVWLQEFLAAIHKYKPDAAIHAGDLKEHYNPVDLRVAKFWVRATKLITALVPLYIDMGNHDRISQSLESKNWLDILRAAGAKTFSSPKWRGIADPTSGCIVGHVAFLPYTGDKALEKKWARELRETAPSTRPQVLVFHGEVQGGVINASGQETCGYKPTALSMDEYDVCFGGHIHGHQKIADNVWYIGSPFCMDWSEANQTKGFVLADVTIDKVSVKQIKTNIPGWYDTEWLELHNIEPESGAHIRSKVPVTSKKLTQQLKDEEARIRDRFPASSGLRLFVIPKIEEVEEEIIVKGNNDQERVAAYVSATWPDDARVDAKKGVSYLSGRLAAVALATRYGSRLRFIEAVGENILPFKSVKVPYRKQGLIYLQGVNKDWPKQSNGSGKTSVLSLLTLIMTGETPKGQKTDAWANERTEGRAWGILRLKDEHNRLVEIERARRPHGLWLRINGKDESTGIKGTGKQETQGVIERLTGYDKRMLMTAVYIDQSIANGFVFGTQTTRMDLVSRIQNLERFDAALKLVAKDIEDNKKQTAELEANLESHESDIATFEDELKDLEQEKSVDWLQRRKVAKKKLLALKEELSLLLSVEHKNKEAKASAVALNKKLDAVRESYHKTTTMLNVAVARLKQANALLEAGKCSVCEQPVGKTWKARASEAEQEIAAWKKDKQAYASEIDELEAAVDQVVESVQGYEYMKAKLTADVANAQLVYDATLAGAQEEEERNAKIEAKKKKYREKLSKAKHVAKACRAALLTLDMDRELFEYAKKAFHRSGMPLYLSAALCPVLNKAAEEYSEIFNGGKVKIMFYVEDGEFNVKIINAAGSTRVKGQSDGESAMAGVVCAFSLRDVAPKTNLLILDEPGHGLDPEGQKTFARGLLKLKDRYETIIVTTHSAIIAGILQGEKTWTVTKQNGISTLAI